MAAKESSAAERLSNEGNSDIQGNASFASYTKYVNPPLGEFLNLSGRNEQFVRAEGCTLFTKTGKQYADWIAGFGAFNLGHNHPEVIEALQDHLTGKVPNLYPEALNPYAGKLARALVERVGPEFGNCFFSSSGSEAVEAALKLAIAATRRRNVLYLEGGYYGMTMGALSMMARGGYRRPFDPLLPHFHPVEFGNIALLEEALVQHQPAAFVLELVQIESGVRAVGHDYLRQARELCNKHGVLLVFDEVQTGMGRTGDLFAFQGAAVMPDILALAKSLGGGLAPIGATVAAKGLFEKAYGDYEKCETHNSTFGGNAFACRAALKTLELMDAPFLERVKKTSRFLEVLLKAEVSGHPLVESCGLVGLLGGVRLKELSHAWFSWKHIGLENFDGHPVAAPLLVHRLYRRGFITQVCGHDWGTLRIEPPLVVGESDCQKFVTSLKQELDWMHENGK